MQTHLRPLFARAFAFCALLSFLTALRAATLSGSISNLATRDLLEGGRVEIPALSLATLSDHTGRYTFPALPTGTHEALFWRFGEQMAVRRGDWKLVGYDTNADTNTGGRGQPVSAAKLYNLAADIHEDRALAATNPAKLKELQSLWDEWNKSNVKPLWGAGSSGDNDGPEPGAGGKKKRQNAKD